VLVGSGRELGDEDVRLREIEPRGRCICGPKVPRRYQPSPAQGHRPKLGWVPRLPTLTRAEGSAPIGAEHEPPEAYETGRMTSLTFCRVMHSTGQTSTQALQRMH